MSELVRVHVVVDHVRRRVAAITGDVNRSHRVCQDLIAAAGGDNAAATQYVDLVDPADNDRPYDT